MVSPRSCPGSSQLIVPMISPLMVWVTCKCVEGRSIVGPKKGLTASEMRTSFRMEVMGILYPRGSVSPELSMALATITFSASYSPF